MLPLLIQNDPYLEPFSAQIAQRKVRVAAKEKDPPKNQKFLPQGSQSGFTRNTSPYISNIYLCELCANFVFFVVKNPFRSGLKFFGET